MGLALGLSLLVGLSRWLGSYLNATSTDSFHQWPYNNGLVGLEILLAGAGFVGAVTVVRAPARRSAASWALVAAAAGVLGYAANDGLYQLITIAL